MIVRIAHAPADEGAAGGAAADSGAFPAAAEAAAPLTSAVDTPGAAEAAKPAEGATAATGEAVAAKPEEKPAEPVETPEAKAEREKTEAATRTADALKALDALKLPEGMLPDQPAMVDFKATAAELGLAPEAAQKLVDAVAPKFHEALTAPLKAWGDTQEAWINEIKADKEVGGDLAKAAGIARRGIDAIMGSDAAKVREALAFTGAGNNPSLFRFLMRVGAMVGEGSPVRGSASAVDQRSAAERMYPSLAKDNP